MVSNLLAATVAAAFLPACGKHAAEQPPSALDYGPGPFTYAVGAAARPLQPSVAGTAPFGYAVAPALPAGLMLDATTGEISGTPAAAVPAASYTITASNGAGHTSASLELWVTAGAPVSMSLGAPTSAHLDSTFAGFSYEKNRINVALFSAGNAGLVSLFNRGGAGILRIGGNSVDKTSWNAAGPGLTTGQVAPADIDRLAGFLRAAGWQVIYGINFAANTPDGMASEAAYAAKSLGDRLYGFELGNEPDLYHGNGLRPTSYSYSDFVGEWNAYAAAILAQVPAAPITGPAAASNTNGYSVPFAHDEAALIKLLTEHYYRANGQSATSTIDLLLQPDPNLLKTLLALQAAAQSNATANGYRMAEANSFYNGGAPGVSDGFGTALWAVDFLFENASNGSSGVNFHGGGSGPGYTPIADDGTNVVEVRPEYYGISLFDMAAPGMLLETTVSAGSLAFSGYAIRGDDGSTAVVLVNKDRTTSAVVALALGATAQSASLLWLTGPSLDSTSGQLLGGATIEADGSWNQIAQGSIAVGAGSFALTVGPGSAVLIRFR